jgi:hypothetical protein
VAAGHVDTAGQVMVARHDIMEGQDRAGYGGRVGHRDRVGKGIVAGQGRAWCQGRLYWPLGRAEQGGRAGQGRAG